MTDPKFIKDLFAGCIEMYKHNKDLESLKIMHDLLMKNLVTWKVNRPEVEKCEDYKKEEGEE